uniref:Uncharacterized protein n=1 Tax=Sphaerodactylus townsendi TaxID=933632 RepID=A0ACB8FG01_9SAUR
MSVGHGTLRSNLGCYAEGASPIGPQFISIGHLSLTVTTHLVLFMTIHDILALDRELIMGGALTGTCGVICPRAHASWPPPLPSAPSRSAKVSGAQGVCGERAGVGWRRPE